MILSNTPRRAAANAAARGWAPRCGWRGRRSPVGVVGVAGSFAPPIFVRGYLCGRRRLSAAPGRGEYPRVEPGDLSEVEQRRTCVAQGVVLADGAAGLSGGGQGGRMARRQKTNLCVFVETVGNRWKPCW